MIIGANEVFGKNLTAIIKHSGKTRAQLCKFLKTKESKILEYENGKKSPSFDEIIWIAKFCNVSASQLMDNIDCCGVKRVSRDGGFRDNAFLSVNGVKNIDDIDIRLASGVNGGGFNFILSDEIVRDGVKVGYKTEEKSYLSSLFNAVSKISSKAVKDMILEIAESSVERVD